MPTQFTTGQLNLETNILGLSETMNTALSIRTSQQYYAVPFFFLRSFTSQLYTRAMPQLRSGKHSGVLLPLSQTS